MWWAALGAVFGLLQYAALNKLVKFILSKKKQTFLSVFIVIGKLSLILLFLFAAAFLSGVNSMIWGSVGMLIIMIVLPIIKGIKNIHLYNSQEIQEEK